MESRAPEAQKIDPNSQRTPNLEAFREFCLVDPQLAGSTTERHVNRISKFLHGDPREYTKQDLRTYLMEIKKTMSASTYKNQLASLKKYFGDYLGMCHLVDSFKYLSKSFSPISVPSKSELQASYEAVESPRDRALSNFRKLRLAAFRNALSRIPTFRVRDPIWRCSSISPVHLQAIEPRSGLPRIDCRIPLSEIFA